MIHRRFAALMLTLAASLGGCSCNQQSLGQKSQPQPECLKPKHLDAVGICVDCTLNADCAAGQQCNLISGSCEAIPAAPDGGPMLPTCGVGAVRCAIDGSAVQNCESLDGGNGWVSVTECANGEVCNPMTLTCAICVPGETVCSADAGPTVFLTCSDDGTHFVAQSCNNVDAGATGYTCQQIVVPAPSQDGGPPQAGLAACQLCSPNSAQCESVADGGVGLSVCDSTGTVLEYDPCYPTNVCLTDGGAGPYCEPYVCLPGQGNCEFPDGGSPQNYTTSSRQLCNSNGTGFVNTPCPNDPVTGGPTVCGPSDGNQGACLTPCQVAESSDSYFGCDYWGTLLSNSQLATNYLGDSSNQSPGTTASDFAFVVSNTSTTLTATVTVAMEGLPSVTATVAPGTVEPVYLPWRPICGSGLAGFGYHLTSDTPVTVYQFNPLHSFLTVNAYGSNSPSCGQDADCQNPNCEFGQEDATCLYNCNNGSCASFSYSNDASLLLPTHLLGTSYVVASYNQITEGNNGNASDEPLAGEFAIVATANNTHINVAFSATTASTNDNTGGGGLCPNTEGNIPAQAKGTIVPFTLSQGQVLQFWAASVGSPECQTSLNGDIVCIYPNDLTGTVVTSVPGVGGGGDGGNTNSPAQPVAVFGGADCTYVPYNQVACDHIEEEMFPFNTWGKQYVGVKTAQYTGATSAYPDYFRLISACGPSSCASGATVTFNPEIPLGVDAQGNPLLLCYQNGNIVPSCNWCNNAGSVTTCTLPPLTSGQTAPWISFQSGASFFASSPQPISVAQYLVSESEAGVSNGQATAVEGDPDILLIPPVEQWRTTYTVLAPNTYLDNYLDMVVNNPDGGSFSYADGGGPVLVDGAPVTVGWNNVPGTSFYAVNHKVCGRTDGATCTGSHSIVGQVPVGVTISGYDSYVTYSYTGGLDLQTITAIKPGG